MRLKLGEVDAKTIVKRILGIAIIYTAIILLNILSYSLLVSGTSGESLVAKLNSCMYLIRVVLTPILGGCY